MIFLDKSQYLGNRYDGTNISKSCTGTGTVDINKR